MQPNRPSTQSLLFSSLASALGRSAPVPTAAQKLLWTRISLALRIVLVVVLIALIVFRIAVMVICYDAFSATTETYLGFSAWPAYALFALVTLAENAATLGGMFQPFAFIGTFVAGIFDIGWLLLYVLMKILDVNVLDFIVVIFIGGFFPYGDSDRELQHLLVGFSWIFWLLRYAIILPLLYLAFLTWRGEQEQERQRGQFEAHQPILEAGDKDGDDAESELRIDEALKSESDDVLDANEHKSVDFRLSLAPDESSTEDSYLSNPFDDSNTDEPEDSSDGSAGVPLKSL